jgi:general secretion pathway protein D
VISKFLHSQTWAGVALAATLGLSLACAPPAWAARASADRADTYTFAFQDADIRQVVEEVLGQAGVPYSIDPGVTGKISFRIEQRLNKPQLVAALSAALEANGVTVVQNGDQVIVTPQSKAKSAAPIRRGVAGAGQAGYEIVAVPLSFAQPTEVSRAMEAISGSDAVLYSNDKLGLILLAGAGPQLRSTLETLKIFDQNTFEDSRIRWFEISQAQATTVAAELDRIVQASGVVGVSVVPLKRLNGIIVFGRSAEALGEIGKWVLRLDTPGREVASSLFVYHPRYTSAEALAKTLGSVVGSTSGVAGSVASPTPTPGPADASSALAGTTQGQTSEDQVRIGADKETNTLLIYTPPAKLVQIQRILNEIDRPARQVFIEASIVEVTLGKDNQFGVDWTAMSNRLTVSSLNNKTGAVGPTFPGFSVTYLGNDIAAAVNALGSRTNLEVVSAPKIIALDNHTARLQIGDQVPVVVQSQQSTSAPNANLVSTVDYRSTGVILSVTPRITGDDQLLLDVSQEVSSVAKTVTSGIDSPTIQQRRFESSLVLYDGGVVALGGLISSTRSTSDSGTPGLKDVPVVGALFRTTGRSQSRSELIVLLTAHIINDHNSADRTLADLAADMHELDIRGLLPKKPK